MAHTETPRRPRSTPSTSLASRTTLSATWAPARTRSRWVSSKQEFQRISDALVVAPVDPELRSRMARWLMSHGHEDEAVDWARLVLADRASDPVMNRLLADYYRRRGQTGLANFHESVASPGSAGGASTP